MKFNGVVKLMNSKIKDSLAIFLCAVLLAALVLVVIVGTMQKNKKSQELQKNIQGNTAAVVADTKTQVTEEVLNPYKKIKNKKSVSVLVLGDYIAQSQGVEDKDKWSSIVSDLVNKNYGAQVTVNILANKDQGILKTLEDYAAKEASSKYDFVIICAGADDVGALKIEQFKQSYEALVRKIKEGYDNCEVISIIESSIRKDKVYPEAIKNICDYYEIPCADAREVFKQSGTDYSKLTINDKQTPNADGYKLYGEAVYNLIKTNVDKEKEITALKKELLFKTN